MTTQQLEQLVRDLQQRVQVLEGQQVSRPHVGPFQRHSATSRSAALANYPRSGSQRHRILEFLLARGSLGATRQEIAQHLGLSDDSVRPRVVELVEGRWIHATDQTRPTPMGDPAEVLVATDRELRAEQIRQDVSPAPIVADEPGWGQVSLGGAAGEQPASGSSATTGAQNAIFDWEG